MAEETKISAEEFRRLAVLEEERQKKNQEVEEEISESLDTIRRSWLNESSLSDHTTLEKKFAEDFDLSLTDAKKQLRSKLKKYEVEGNDIPKLIKQMRKYRRTLKGSDRENISKSIDNLIDSYADHLDKSMDNIYWIQKYKPVLKDMTCSEDHLIKLSYVQDESTRRELVDTLCKYWESKIERKDMGYNKEFTILSKEMTSSKRKFKQIIKKHMKSIDKKDIIKQSIVKLVSEEAGISARQIHERLPKNLFNRTTPSIISKMAISCNVTNVNGAFYKFSDDIKKDIYSYTAAFIDSDGYITMDKKFNPRVGLVATGERGKAFMLEMHKSLGCGRLHLDQKSPQDTRPVNRLNFYSAADVTEILTKCRPHFKMKGPNADILLELIRMKKSHKKAEWYTDRKTELFQLMKYENHKDHVGYDFSKDGVDITTVAKLHDKCKMFEMDKLEGVTV
tara:strand:- start:425 stop:1774 length:1350 start_codon:yes stop_codon:yes gene_type:complete